MIQKLHLTQVYVNEEQEMKSRDGRTFKTCRTAIKVKEYGDKWLSGFASKQTADKLKADSAKDNYEIELEITKSDKLDKTGNPYINWKFVNKEIAQELYMSQLKERITTLEEKVRNIENALKPKQSNSDFTKNSARQTTTEEQENIDLNGYPESFTSAKEEAIIPDEIDF